MEIPNNAQEGDVLLVGGPPPWPLGLALRRNLARPHPEASLRGLKIVTILCDHQATQRIPGTTCIHPQELFWQESLGRGDTDSFCSLETSSFWPRSRLPYDGKGVDSKSGTMDI